MSDDRRIGHLRRLTSDAIDDRRRAEMRRAEGATDGAAPGDLFVLPATRELPVEWAVLETDDERLRALVVPVDTQPLLGPGDLSVADADGGPLAIRCRYGVWIRLERLGPTLRVGSLGPTVVSRARTYLGAKVDAMADDTDAGDPVYQDWVDEVLTPARLALGASRSRAGTGEAG